MIILIIIVLIVFILGVIKKSPPQALHRNHNYEKKSIEQSLINNSIYEEYDFSLWRLDNKKYLDDSLSLSDLLISKEISDIVYFDLVGCFEWKFKRLKILIRDKYTCQSCNKVDKFNHVHHTYYLKNKLPWEIEDSALVTLCYSCHRKIHEESKIPVYKILNGNKLLDYYEEFKCYRCGGIGYISIYKHVENGICFRCRGNTINKTVFSDLLTEYYDNLNSYQDNLKRNEYTNFIDGIDDETLFNCLPDKTAFNKKALDELPF